MKTHTQEIEELKKQLKTANETITKLNYVENWKTLISNVKYRKVGKFTELRFRWETEVTLNNAEYYYIHDSSGKNIVLPSGYAPVGEGIYLPLVIVTKAESHSTDVHCYPGILAINTDGSMAFRHCAGAGIKLTCNDIRTYAMIYSG